MRLTGRLISPTGLTAAALALALVVAGAVQLDGPRKSVPTGLPEGGSWHSYPPGSTRSTAVSLQDIARAGRGTPGQGLLMWWRDLQLRHPPRRIVAHFAPGAIQDPARLKRELRQLAYLFPQLKPELIDSSIREGSAEVTAILHRKAGGGDRPPDAPGLLQTFSLVRTAGGWKLRDDAFLRQRYDAEVAFAARERRGGR